MSIFKKQTALIAPPTGKVAVRSYDAKMAKKGLLTAAFAGLDDAAIAGITTYFEQDANVLAGLGYLPVATAWNSGQTALKGPCLTVTYTKL